MRSDIVLGVTGMIVLAAIAFSITARWTASWSTMRRYVAAVVTVCLMFLYADSVWQRDFLARLLPYSNLIVVGNWFLLFLAVLAGIIRAWKEISLPRRVILQTVLASAGMYALLSPLLGSPPKCGELRGQGGHLMQTTDFTCSPASAATLLEMHGIPATEREMAELCLTRNGTSWLGLYRGLKLKTAGTPWDVEMVCCDPDDLRDYAVRPLILEVGLAGNDGSDPALVHELGWTPGVNHSVVLKSIDRNQRARIVDPALEARFEIWDDAALKMLWRGRGMRLVERGSGKPITSLAAR